LPLLRLFYSRVGGILSTFWRYEGDACGNENVSETNERWEDSMKSNT
jgi:hypothetical protein